MQKILLLMGAMIVSHTFSAGAADDSSLGSNKSLYTPKIGNTCPEGYKVDDFQTQPDEPCTAIDPLNNVTTLRFPKKKKQIKKNLHNFNILS